MKAMIFAAGLGSRLKPLTDHTPKALIPVAGQPMLEHVIEKLKAAGFNEIIVNVHHFAEQIIDFLATHRPIGVNFRVSDERDRLLDTGGGLQHAMPLLLDSPISKEEPFLVHNVDILSNCDLSELAHYHATHRPDAVATLLVSRRKTSRYLLFDEHQTLCGWVNKDTMETKPAGFVYQAGQYQEYAYSGIQMVSPRLLPLLPEGKYSIIDFYLTHCRQLPIQCYAKEDLQLMDIGKPATLEQAEAFLGQLHP